MILKSNIKKLKKIYHISDIQIRNLKRHAEYEGVFENLYKFMRQDPADSVCYIGGDIAHSKTDMSPELIDQLSRLFTNLADICPTLIIAGNHDCNLNNRSRMDCLTPIVNNLNHPDLHYLKDTGVYYLGGVGFSVLDCWDDPENLPDPKAIDSDTKVALYHGTVDKAETDLGFMLPSDIKTHQFDGYDMVLLGDIHKMQTMQKYKPGKPAIRYCGSLVQQNHGETLKGHGVSVWDVKKRSFKHQEIENEYGYYTMEIENGLVPDVDDLPSKARLRVRVKNTSNTDLKKALTIIRHRYNIAETSIVRLDDLKVNESGTEVDFGDITDPDVQYGLIVDFIKNERSIKDNTLEKIKSIHKDLGSQLNTQNLALRNINWELKNFEFSNMFAYGENNKIDFERCNGVIGLFSPNASGKSSILDALTFCLFDKSSRAYKADNIMNHSKNDFWCKAEFTIANELHTIERTGFISRRGKVKVDVDFYKINDSGEKISLNGDQRNTTNKNIKALIGTYEDFILTSFSSQTNNAVFLDHNQTEKKDILARFLGLGVFDQLYDLAQKESSGLQTMLKNFMDVDYDQQIADIEAEVKVIKKTSEKIDKKYVAKEEEANDFANQIMDNVKLLRPLDSNIEPIDELQSKVKKIDNLVLDTKENIEKYDEQIAEHDEQHEILNNRLQSSKFSDIENKKQEHDKLIEQKKIAKIDIDKLKIQVRNKLDKIEKLGNLEHDPDCSYCMSNPFTLDAIKTKEDLEEDKQKSSTMLTSLKTIENQLLIHNDVPEFYNEWQAIKKEITDITVSKTKQSALKKSSTDTISSALVEKKYLQENIRRSRKYQKDIKYNDKITDLIEELKSKQNVSKTELRELGKDLQHYTGKSASLEAKKQEILSTIEKVKDLESKYEAYKYYLSATSKNGVSYNLISKILSTVENEVNEILSQIVDFAIVFEMDGKSVNTFICYDDDKSWPLDLASGMEKFISSLAIRIALTNVSNLPRTNFIAIDEGWGTLDSDNLNNTHQLFQYLKTRYQFSLVISHIDAMRDFTDQLLEIQVDEGFSQINF